MAGFKYAGDLNGHKRKLVRDYLIPTATAIDAGEPVQFTQGTGVITIAQASDFDDYILGVATAAHAANSGTSIELTYSPTAIYVYHASKTYTATGGSTTTIVDSSLLPQTDDFWIGGAVKIVSCAADSSLNGKVILLTDSTGSTGTLTFATQAAAFASGDTFQLCLGNYAENHLGYDLDSDAMNPDFDADGGATLRFLYAEPMLMDMYFMFEHSAAVT